MKMIKFLREMLAVPSPSGYTEEISAYIAGVLDRHDITYKKTRKNAIHVTLDGVDSERARTLSAHVDTLGGMVKDIKNNGYLVLTQIGSYKWNSVEGEYCTIHTANGEYEGTFLLENSSSHVHGMEVAKSERSDKTMVVRIDEDISSEEDVRNLGIEVGDFVSFDPRTKFHENGFIKSRYLDDKAGAAVLLKLILDIKESGNILPHETHFIFSTYEEVGHGASHLPSNTEEILAIDMAAVGSGQASSEMKVTICVKDSSGPYDLSLRRKLIQLSKDNDIDYVLDIYPYYASDATSSLRGGNDVRHALIGPGVAASHSFERTHVKALNSTYELAHAFINSKMQEV